MRILMFLFFIIIIISVMELGHLLTHSSLTYPEVSSKVYRSGFGGLEVACWPLVPKFVGSNPAEAVGFLRAKKSSARLPSEGK
jgi:hypothetical protein